MKRGKKKKKRRRKKTCTSWYERVSGVVHSSPEPPGKGCRRGVDGREGTTWRHTSLSPSLLSRSRRQSNLFWTKKSPKKEKALFSYSQVTLFVLEGKVLSLLLLHPSACKHAPFFLFFLLVFCSFFRRGCRWTFFIQALVPRTGPPDPVPGLGARQRSAAQASKDDEPAPTPCLGPRERVSVS